MKRIAVLLLLTAFLCLATTALAEEIPDLQGDWSGHGVMIVLKNGKLATPPSPEIVYSITKQEGRLGYGVKKLQRSLDGVQHEETFVGVISADGKQLRLADHEAGYALGEILENGTVLEFTYLSDGSSKRPIKMAAGYHRLTRK